MNQIPNIEDTNTREVEEKTDCELYEHIPVPYDVAFWHCKVCGKELYFDTIESLETHHQQLQKARQDERERIATELDRYAHESHSATINIKHLMEKLVDHSELDQPINSIFKE